MLVHGDHEHGAAWRRRQRRLRMHWRHEQLTLQTLLATYDHHAGPRGQMKARSRGEEIEMNIALARRLLAPGAASTMCYRMDDEGDVLAARPPPLVEVRPQSGVQRHTVEQIFETFVLFRFSMSSATGGDSVGGIHAEARHCDPGAGYRSAQALSRANSTAFCGSSSAEGRTVGGSADGVVSLSSLQQQSAEH